MKKITTLISSILICLGAFAQLPASGGPDSFGYTFKNSTHAAGPSYNWFDITTIGTPVTGLSDDNFVGPFNMSGFSYYTSNPTQFWIGSNGYISFSPINIASTSASFPIIPSVGGPNNFIAPFLTDLTLGGTSNQGQVFRYDQGDTICVSFINVPFWVNNANQQGGDNTFQVILNKADSSITFNYEKQIGTPDPTAYTANYLSIGIENGTGADGLQYYRGVTTPIINTSVKYDYPTLIQPITDAEVNWVDNDHNAGKFLAINSSITPVANIKNAGNQNINSTVSISYLITNTTGSILNLGSTSIPSLAVNSDTTLALGNPYSPSSPGQYIFTTYISGVTGDNVSTNDTNSMLFVVVDTSQTTQTLDYSPGINTAGSIGWSGGNGGSAVYFEPPYYPAKIVSTKFFITTLGTPAVGFYSLLYDDTGRSTIQGALIDSAFVPSTAITINSYYTNTLTNNVVINSGGVYLLWLMEGDGINLGTSTGNPPSRNTYEVLFGSWSNYRSSGTEDFLLGLEIEPITVGIEDGINQNELSIYPNPSVDAVWINTTKRFDLNTVRIVNIEGKEVPMKILQFDNKIQILRGNASAGIYFFNYGNTSTKLVFKN
jgi:hypothetical protein